MQFSDPRSTVLQLGLREGMRVADIGAGIGHYGLAAAPAVGIDGKVYLIDIQEEVLKHALANAKERGLHGVEIIWSDIERIGGTKLKDASMDVAILANALFQIEKRPVVAQEILRILKPGGLLLVVDWAGAYGGIGPAPECVITEYQAEELFIGAGFHKKKDFRSGAHHYAIVFTKP